jgi:thioredoxin 1
MAEGIMEIDDGNFEAEVLQADKPVMVDFWAPWCGPCKAIGPMVEDLADTFGDKVKCDVVEQITGMVAKTKLEEALNKIT